jgi:pimeloyl-ACP methyl ester carboxylesterase
VRVPTLIVIGDADVADMLEISQRLEDGIPGAQRVVVPDTAHALPLERPAELNRLLLDFLGTRA